MTDNRDAFSLTDWKALTSDTCQQVLCTAVCQTCFASYPESSGFLSQVYQYILESQVT